jgi:hypothetical protein
VNTNTGVIYRDLEAITDAEARGESIARVSERVAGAMIIGTQIVDRAKAKRKRKQARQDRKHNRGQR